MHPGYHDYWGMQGVFRKILKQHIPMWNKQVRAILNLILN